MLSAGCSSPDGTVSFRREVPQLPSLGPTGLDAGRFEVATDTRSAAAAMPASNPASPRIR